MEEGSVVLTADEERELGRRVAAGEREAVERLVLANLGLVHFLARRYEGRGVPAEDLVQEGTVGLMRAAEKFDWQRGVRFGTYAVWWIRQSMTKAVVDGGRTIRLPGAVWVLLARVRAAELALAQPLGRAPTLAEVAAAVGVGAERLAEVWWHQGAVASLDRQVSEDGGALGALLPDPSTTPEGGSSASEVGVVREMIAAAVATLLETLTPRERHVIHKRFGFGEHALDAGDGDGATLTAIALTMGVSRERTRQIEHLALEKLKRRARMGRWREALVR